MPFLGLDLAQALIIGGIVLLTIEIMVLGFATFYLFFVGLGAILSGLLFSTGLVNATPLSAFISVAVVSTLSALLLWRPLQKMQRSKKAVPVTSDLVGHRFFVSENLSKGVEGSYQYSGIRWKISSSQEIAAGAEVEVVEVSVGRMRVQIAVE